VSGEYPNERGCVDDAMLQLSGRPTVGAGLGLGDDGDSDDGPVEAGQHLRAPDELHLALGARSSGEEVRAKRLLVSGQGPAGGPAGAGLGVEELFIGTRRQSTVACLGRRRCRFECLKVASDQQLQGREEEHDRRE